MLMADDRLVGWGKKEITDFYDLYDDELVREKELAADYLDGLGDESVTVAELVEGVKSWRFGHVIVDEAQDLSPMQWRMIQRRSTQGSVTIVGDLAQRSHGSASNWEDLFAGQVKDYNYQELRTNYRCSAEVNSVASKILLEMDLDLKLSEPIRASGQPVEYVQCLDQAKTAEAVLEQYQALKSGKRMAVICVDSNAAQSLREAVDTIGFDKNLEPENLLFLDFKTAKGLEFDSVFINSVDSFLDLDFGLNALYIAATRATSRLAVAYRQGLPEFLN